jgi:starch synthase
MRILHAAAEIHPVVRTGGLGDVVAALPAAQQALGHDVRLILPAYPALKAALEEPVIVAMLRDRFDAPVIRLLRGRFGSSALITYLIDAPSLFDRPGNPYLGPDGRDWPDNAQRFGLLGWAAANLARGELDVDWTADALHAHDWHAGLAPAYLRLAGAAAVTSVFTIHNIAYQGLFPPAMLGPLELPHDLFTVDGLEFWGQISFMKAGLVFADWITTVSPGYAREIATPDYGCGLNGVIAARDGAVFGILNGVDGGQWDPTNDPALESRFDAERLEARLANRDSLLRRFGLRCADGPLYGVVSRLTPQKGLDLVYDALPVLLETGGSLVLLGSGDAPLEEAFRAAAQRYPDRVAVVIGFDDPLSHVIMAGSDVILVPSRFEPCGLTQLYALRYGAVPLVRRTGGLGDTVVDASPGALADQTATGIVFDAATADAVRDALQRVTALYHDRDGWRALQQTGMRQVFSWEAAALQYIELYSELNAAV